MALFFELDIYRAAYSLLDVAVDYVQNMPRPFKAAIGDRVRDLCLDIVLLIFRANCARDKAPHLETLVERKEELDVLLRLCRDKRFISTQQYARAIELTSSVGKQANGWRRYASPAT